MKRLLLISSSVVHPSGYLEHCSPFIESFLLQQYPKRDSVILFIPYAKKNHVEYTKQVADAFKKFGFNLISVHDQISPIKAISEASAFFVGGGNSFRLLKSLYDLKLLEPIQSRVLAGIPYIGTSAGTNVATVSIHTTNDMPIVYPPSLNALNLVPFNINPHYMDPEKNSVHKGETREQRIKEFHEENDNVVVGLREGCMLQVEGNNIMLLGTNKSRIFKKGIQTTDADEYAPNSDLSFLLSCKYYNL